jgi:hypothetical protein
MPACQQGKHFGNMQTPDLRGMHIHAVIGKIQIMDELNDEVVAVMSAVCLAAFSAN